MDEIAINPCVTAFGYNRVVNEFHRFCQFYSSLPVVSIGSGFGSLERSVKNISPKQEFILIDPNPNSYTHLPSDQYNELSEKYGLAPTYHYLKDLSIERPRLFAGGRSILLLNWSDWGRENPYDLEALLLLRPVAIFLITHLGKSANSKQFHFYLQSKQNPYHKKRILSIDPDLSFKRCSRDHTEFSIQWLEDLPQQQGEEKTREMKIKCEIPHEIETPCTVWRDLFEILSK